MKFRSGEMAEFYKELADKTVTDIMNGKPDRLGNATKLRLLSRLLRHVSENGVANIEQLHYMDAVSWNLLSDDEQSRVSRAYRQARGITFTRLKADAPSQSGGS
jgi:hypothetical protein